MESRRRSDDADDVHVPRQTDAHGQQSLLVTDEVRQSRSKQVPLDESHAFDPANGFRHGRGNGAGFKQANSHDGGSLRGSIHFGANPELVVEGIDGPGMTDKIEFPKRIVAQAK